MTWPPIIDRELRVALRKKRPARARLLTASLCAGMVLLFALPGVGRGQTSAGRCLHLMLCLVGFYLAIRAPFQLAGVFAGERRNQTLGLLFLSGLSAGEVFASKVLSAAMIALTGLLAVFPMLALPFFMGGVSFDLFLATICSLPTLLIFTLAIILLASVLTQDEGAAVLLAVMLAFALCAMTPAMYFALAHRYPNVTPSAWWLRLSPAYGPYLAWTGLRTAPLAEFWKTVGLTLAWSGLCLALAAIAVKRLWREQEENASEHPWHQRWNQFIHGTAGVHRQLGWYWLEANPFVWLAARDRLPATLAWAIVGGIATSWLLGWAVWGRSWLVIPNFLATAALLNASVRWLIFYTVAKTISAPRRDGTYELLLTTPLQPSDIVWGQLEAMGWLFNRVSRCLLILTLALMLAGLVACRWSIPTLLLYLFLWGCLLDWSWRQSRQWRHTLPAAWAALNCALPLRAVWQAPGLSRSHWLCFLLMFSNLLLFPFSPSDSPERALTTAMGSVFFLWLFLTCDNPDPYEGRLIDEFREVVREPLPEPDNRRFKEWDPRQRFPWGWSMVQQQLHERLARRQRAQIHR
jgi:ABC-type transport system involved in multi-copper enzyme maturation permease subunit